MKITENVIKEMIEHSRQTLPNESCGYLAGRNGRIEVLYKMTNVDASPEHFSFDPKEQFSVVKSARKEQCDLLGVYHSHPSSPARLSEEDLRLLNDPKMTYVIVSLKDEKPDVKAFSIVKQDDTIEIKNIELVIEKGVAS